MPIGVKEKYVARMTTVRNKNINFLIMERMKKDKKNRWQANLAMRIDWTRKNIEF